MLVYVALGLVCWLVTLILTEGEIARPLREAVPTKWKLDYLVACPLCAGVWIGLTLGIVAGPRLVGPSWIAWLLDGLLTKAVGHVVLDVTTRINREEVSDGFDVR